MTDWASVLNRAFVNLRENAGDTGDSGDTNAKALHSQEIPASGSVTTLKPRGVTPVTHRFRAVTGVTGRSNLVGDKQENRNSKEFQSASSSVTTVTGVTAEMERPVHQVLQRLQEMNAPARFSAETWRQLIADARNFFDRWSQHADLLGWTDEDLVGVHPAAPMARYDAMGLLLLMRGGEVTHLRQDSAVIRALSGVSLVYRKAPHSAAVPIWQL